MANVLINEDTMTDIADAIRSKKGVSTTYKPADMPSAIESISGGGITPTGTINITTNGTHDVTNYASASVAVPQGTTPTGTKNISITQNGTTTEDVTNYASAQITVNVQGGGSTGGLTLIDTIAVNGRAVQVDYASAWDAYDFFVIHLNLTLSASDWIYAAFNSTNSNKYTAKVTESNNITAFVRRNNDQTNPMSAYCFFKDNQESISTGSFSYLYVYAYTSSTVMTGYAKIYGGKYATD